MRAYDVSVNGVWLSEIGASLFERRLPVLPESEDNTLKLAGRDGVIDFGGSYGTRPIGLTLGINASPAEFHRVLGQLARLFNAKRGELTLAFTDLPDRTYKAVYSGTLALVDPVGSRLIDVPLKMNDPFPQSDERIEELTITRSGQAVSVHSDSDVGASPVLVLTNTGTNTIRNFRITNEYDYE